MSAGVAITEIIAGRVVELALILTGGWLIRAAIPQLRISAPKGNGNGADKPDGTKP